MPSRPWRSLGLRPRDPPGPGRHYFFTNNALAGILIIIEHHIKLIRLGEVVVWQFGGKFGGKRRVCEFVSHKFGKSIY